MRKFISEVLLIMVTIVWGLAFIWQNIASKVLGPLTVVGIRSVIAVIFIILSAVLMPALYKSQDPKNLAMKVSKKKEWILGKAGFITVLYICFVPFIGIFLGNKLNKFFIIGLVLAVIGFYFISVKEEFSLEIGDIVVLISALLFGIHIIVIDYSAARVNSMFLSIVQLVVVSILSLVFAIFTEKIILADILSVIWPLLAVGVLSSGVGYTLQIVGQKNVPPHTASLILSLESIVAVIGGVLILNEHVGIREGLGMLIVFAGIIISQVPDKKQIEK